jgi:hypothetical protein
MVPLIFEQYAADIAQAAPAGDGRDSS